MSTDQEIVQRLCAQDHAALGELMDLYATDIYRMAYLLTSDIHLAEDISQETFLIAYRKILQYKGKGKLKSWLVKIAVNECRSRMRKFSWKQLILKEMEEESYENTVAGPEEQLMNQSLLEVVHSLPYKYREVIVLHYYQGLSILEMSKQLKEKEGTIKSKLSRARSLLKGILLEGGWNDER